MELKFWCPSLHSVFFWPHRTSCVWSLLFNSLLFYPWSAYSQFLSIAQSWPWMYGAFQNGDKSCIFHPWFYSWHHIWSPEHIPGLHIWKTRQNVPNSCAQRWYNRGGKPLDSSVLHFIRCACASKHKHSKHQWISAHFPAFLPHLQASGVRNTFVQMRWTWKDAPRTFSYCLLTTTFI